MPTTPHANLRADASCSGAIMAGISVTTGVEETAAGRSLEGFLMRQHQGRPFITLKLAGNNKCTEKDNTKN